MKKPGPGHGFSPQRALPTETKVESGTSQRKSGTSVNLSNSGEGVGPRVQPTESTALGARTCGRGSTHQSEYLTPRVKWSAMIQTMCTGFPQNDRYFLFPTFMRVQNDHFPPCLSSTGIAVWCMPLILVLTVLYLFLTVVYASHSGPDSLAYAKLVLQSGPVIPLIDSVYHSTLGLRVIRKRREKTYLSAAGIARQNWSGFGLSNTLATARHRYPCSCTGCPAARPRLVLACPKVCTGHVLHVL